MDLSRQSNVSAFYMLYRLVIAFLSRSKHLLISWLQSPSAVIFSTVQFSHSVMSDSLWPHESQYARPPCPSPTPGVHSDSLPSSRWCHPAISSSVVPSPPAPNPSQHQSLSNESTFHMGWPKYWSFSLSIIPSKEIPWSPSEWTGWISLQSKGLSRVFSKELEVVESKPLSGNEIFKINF